MSDMGVVDIATSAAPAQERRASGSAIHTRQLLGALAATLVGATAVSAAVLTGPTIGSINSGVEVVSSASTSLMAELADALPVGYAFGAGMVAALNPCGFALLPAYIGLYLGSTATQSGPRRFARAFEVSAAMSAGFIVLFGSAGVVLALASSSIARYFPWVGLAIGVLLLISAGRMIGGASFYASGGERVADRLGVWARRNGYAGYFSYGLAYGAASLCCTLPIFLTVVAGALTTAGTGSAAVEFLLYALGMGLVVTVVTLCSAVFQSAAAARARSIVRFVQPASVALLLIAGAYIIYYWLTLGGLLRVVLRS